MALRRQERWRPRTGRLSEERRGRGGGEPSCGVVDTWRHRSGAVKKYVGQRKRGEVRVSDCECLRILSEFIKAIEGNNRRRLALA